MNLPFAKTLLLLSSLIGVASCATPEDKALYNAKTAAKSGEIINIYQGQLMAKLGAALQNGGPKAGVEICATASPQIAAEVSKQNNVSIKRISLKPRSPIAVPDTTQKAYLIAWLNSPQKADGYPKDIVYKAQEDGQEYIYYMRAITLKDKPCTTCHGENIDPELKAEINKAYPNDMATGFKPGDLRGAFLVKWRESDIK